MFDSTHLEFICSESIQRPSCRLYLLSGKKKWSRGPANSQVLPTEQINSNSAHVSKEMPLIPPWLNGVTPHFGSTTHTEARRTGSTCVVPPSSGRNGHKSLMSLKKEAFCPTNSFWALIVFGVELDFLFQCLPRCSGGEIPTPDLLISLTFSLLPLSFFPHSFLLPPPCRR